MIWNDDIQGFEIPDEKAYEERHEARMDELHEALSSHKTRMAQIKKEFEKRNVEFEQSANLEKDLNPNPVLAEMDKELSKLLDW